MSEVRQALRLSWLKRRRTLHPNKSCEISCFLVAALLLLCLTSCASEPNNVGVNRLSSTGLMDGDKVAVIVTEDDSKGAPFGESALCLKSWMTGRNSNLLSDPEVSIRAKA